MVLLGKELLQIIVFVKERLDLKLSKDDGGKDPSIGWGLDQMTYY